MINRIQGIKAQVCQKHGQPILAYQQEIPFCQTCFVEQSGMVPVDEYYKKLDKIIFKENEENDQQLELLQQVLNELSTYQTNINQNLEKIISLIKEQISMVEIQSQQFQNIIDQTQNQQKLLTQLEEELKNQQKGNSSIKQIILKSLEEFYWKYNNNNNNNLDQVFQLLRKTQKEIDREKRVKQMRTMQQEIDKRNMERISLLSDLQVKQYEQIMQETIDEHHRHDDTIFEGYPRSQPQKEVIRDGAIEALIKELHPSKFINQFFDLKIISTIFEVYKVELCQKSFEQNITTIYKLKIPQDYLVQKQGVWNCVRSLKSVAFSETKEVYLMKNDQRDVYVMKLERGFCEYRSMSDAIAGIRNHLISQQFMKKFMAEITSKLKDQKIPPLKYSDLYILKENDSSFWVAEKFLDGQFQKFNDDFGYINPDQTLVNHLAQCFSCYTYQHSDMNYMINDIQAVGYHFTDPIINTKQEDQESIVLYVCTFVSNQNDQYKKYLEVLGLEDLTDMI